MTKVVKMTILIAFIWRPSILSELTPMIFNTELTHLGLEASVYLRVFYHLFNDFTFAFFYSNLKIILLFLELNKNPVEGFSAGLIDDLDIYKWEVLIIGPPDTL